MDTYRNMNASNGRNCNSSMNQGCRQRDMRSCGRPNNRVLQDGQGRSMEVECVCVASKRECGRSDQMEKLGDQFPLVMSYVPWQ